MTEYGRDLGCTVIGGYVYRGEAFPVLEGTYLFADYCSGLIFAIDGTTAHAGRAGARSARSTAASSAFGEDANGELY